MNIYLTQKNTNHQIAELPFKFFKANETISDELIIYPEHKQQKFMGFGASVTESSSSIYKSEVAHRILSDDPTTQMPPPESKLSLSDNEKALILRWIEQGAKWKEHWSFIAPKLPKIPKSN